MCSITYTSFTLLDTMAPGVSDMKLLRVVVREDFSQSRSDAFIRDLKEAVSSFRLPSDSTRSFPLN